MERNLRVTLPRRAGKQVGRRRSRRAGEPAPARGRRLAIPRDAWQPAERWAQSTRRLNLRCRLREGSDRRIPHMAMSLRPRQDPEPAQAAGRGLTCKRKSAKMLSMVASSGGGRGRRFAWCAAGRPGRRAGGAAAALAGPRTRRLHRRRPSHEVRQVPGRPRPDGHAVLDGRQRQLLRRDRPAARYRRGDRARPQPLPATRRPTPTCTPSTWPGKPS